MKTLRTLLDARHRDAAAPDAVFCHFLRAGQETIIRRGELWREAARHADLLHHRGVQPGEVVVIILPHSPELFYSFLGAMLAGAIPSFMPPPSAKQDSALYWRSHEKLFARLGSGALVAGADHRAAIQQNIPGLSLRLVAVEDAANCSSDFTPVEVSSAQIALLQHSSGTTGLKKGVALSHRAILRQVTAYAQALGLRADDRVVSWLPLYHDMGLIACFLLPLLARIPVVMLDPFEWVVNPRSLFAAITKYRPTLCWQPNFAFHHLCRTVRPLPEFDLSSLRIWNDCSEPCRAESLQLFARTFGGIGVKLDQLQVCYAMAETVFAVTQTVPVQAPRVLSVDAGLVRSERRIEASVAGQSALELLSAGRVVSGLDVRILDEAGAVLPEDRVGVISISGACLFEGYFKRPEETNRRLRDGWYQTGDLGFLHHGELYVTGRVHDLIIVHGKNYYAHELEYLVNQVPGVHPGRAVAVGWFRPEVGSEDIVIIAEHDVSAASDRASLAQEIKRALLNSAGLLVYDVRVVSPGWLVKTTSGKISRSENLAKYLGELNRASAA